jgi:hypothetical protein
MDLISYLMNYLQNPSTAVAARPNGGVSVPGRGLVPLSGPPILDGEWSELPRALSGPKGALVKGASSALASTGASAGMDAMLGPMGALIAAGDGRPDNSLSDMQALTQELAKARAAKHAAAAATMPQGAPPQQPPMPSVPISMDYPTMPGATAASASGAGAIPWWANASGMDHSSNPMPQPRPQQAPPAPPQAGQQGSPGPIPGAMGPTSMGGAPLVNPNGSIPGASGPTSVGGAPLSPPQSNGSGLIAQMLQLLQQKASNQSPGNNADPSTYGGSSPYNGANS